MTDSAEFKRSQLAELQAARRLNLPSILDGMSLEVAPEPDPSTELPALRPCPGGCNKGMVQGLLSKYECAVCDGTGFDMSDPVTVVKALMVGVNKLRKHTKDVKREFREFRWMWSEDEIKARRELLHAEKHHSRFD